MPTLPQASHEVAEPHPCIVTTSWDDGGPSDLRVAEMLVKHNLAGTFYISRSSPSVMTMSDSSIRELASMPGIEIGSHTTTHPDLRQLGRKEFDREVSGCKDWLEDLVGESVTSFCYPKGYCRRHMRSWLEELGVETARTTANWRNDFRFDQYFLPTSTQIFHHTAVSQVRHAIREGNLLGLRNTGVNAGAPPKAVLEILGGNAANAYSLHLWGHSWELDRYNSWDELGECLQILASLPMLQSVPNSVLARMNSKKRG
jgi:peptidoglycan-N-acetylglucosamine deacetylase